MRRVLVTVVAVALVVAAEVTATLSATVAHGAKVHHARMVRARVASAPYGGEPHLSTESRVPAGPWMAAVRFVRDYALWSSRRLARIPASDATRRVIRLLERQQTNTTVAADEERLSVRISLAGGRRYVVTSAVGNFLVAKRGSRWLAVSLPGD